MVPLDPKGYNAGMAFGEGMPRVIIKFLSSQVLAVLLAPVWGWAVPLERFESPLELECEHDEVCTKFARSKLVLGGGTGIVLSAGSEGKAKITIRQAEQGRLELLGNGEAVHSLTLVWDGDSKPEGLSAAGLGCFDLTASGASAFILRGLGLAATCPEPADGESCSPLEVESRIYDAGDATGQRFSASVLRRPVPRNPDELVIPFSNFVREGPNGLARPTCVGAISITFKLEGYKDVSLSIGPIYTNGSDGLTLVLTPTPTPSPSATPTEAPTAAPVLSQSTSVATLETPLTGVSGTDTPEVAASSVGAALIFTTPSQLEVFEDERSEQVVEPRAPGVGRDPAAKEPKRPGIVPENAGEVVYGAVVSGAQ